MKKIFQLSILSICFLSCHKNDDPVITNNINPHTIAISGITETDALGNITGNIDSTDWKTTDVFSSYIDSLFLFSDSLNYSHVHVSIVGLSEFPNPVSNYFQIAVQSNDTSVIKYVIVDSTAHIYARGSQLLFADTSNISTFNFSGTNYPSSKLYRVYYKIYSGVNNSFAQGHGDIKKY